jgi:O-antigen/teichoic acid export membrane protein
MAIDSLRSKVERSPLLKRFVNGCGWLLGGGSAATILTALSTFAIAGYLGVELYGVIALISSTVLLVSGVLTLRTTEVVVKFLIDFLEENEQEKASELIKLGFVIDFLVALLAVLVLYFGSELILSLVFDSTTYLRWFQLYSLTPLFCFCYASSVAVLRVANKFVVIASIDVFNAMLLLVGSVILIFIGAEWSQFIILMVVVALIRGLLLVWSVFYGLYKLNLSINFSVNLQYVLTDLKDIVRLMLTTTLVFIIKTIHTQVDTVIVGSILGPASSGAYKLARNIVQMLAFPTNTLFQVSFPEFVRLLKNGEMALFQKVIQNLIIGTCILCSVYLLGVWFVAPYVLPFFIGDSYVAGIQLLPVLVIGLSLVLISQYWHAALVAINCAGQVVLSMSISLIVQITTLLLLLPVYGLKISAIAYVLYCLIRAILLYSRFSKYVTYSIKV